MKKFLFFIFSAVCIGIILPAKTYAFDLTVGATTWYAVWEIKADGESHNGSQDVKKDKASFLYGPVLSSKITDDFSISFVYLYGKFNIKLDSDALGVHERAKYKRNDGDLALNYRLNNYFKVFVELKYVGFDIPYKVVLAPAPYTRREIYIKHHGYGSGLGLSFTCPISYNLFLLCNISGLYLRGREKLEVPSNSYYNSGYNEKCKEYGINSSLSIAYNITPASIVINLGGRYQYVRTVYEGTVFENGKLSDITNHIYGTTLTATYTFSF